MSNISKRKRTNLTAGQKWRKLPLLTRFVSDLATKALDKVTADWLTQGASVLYSKEPAGSEDMELNEPGRVASKGGQRPEDAPATKPTVIKFVRYGKLKTNSGPIDGVIICNHCGFPRSLRNPSGYCDHLYWPDNCKVCSNFKTNEDLIP